MRHHFKCLVALAVLALGTFAFTGVATAEPVLCDADGDNDVDRLDIRAIGMARNAPASGPDDARDADGDGKITVLDARRCVASCGLPRCAEISGNFELETSELAPEEAAIYGPDLKGIQAQDSRGNELQIILPDVQTVSDFTIIENVSLGDISYTYVTNKMIEIRVPQEVSGRQLVIIKPASSFDYVYQFSGANGQMNRLPFVLLDDGSVQIRPTPIDGSIYIALVY